MPEDFDSILQTGSARFAEATRPAAASTLRGRARRRRRQRVAGATALVGVAAAVGTMLGGGFGIRATPAPPGTTAPTTTPSPPPPAFTAGWDPVEQHAAFGWLPAWVSGVSYQSGAGDTEAAVATAQAGVGARDPLWLIVSKQEPAARIQAGGAEVKNSA